MFASLDSFLASEGAQIIGMIIAGLITAGLFGTMLTLLFKVDAKCESAGSLAANAFLRGLEHGDRLDRAEEGISSLNQRLSVLEADLSKRQAKAAEFKARIEKSGKSEKKAKA